MQLLKETGLASSLSEARRAVAEGGANINNVRITDPEHVPARSDLLHGKYLVLRQRQAGGGRGGHAELTEPAADISAGRAGMAIQWWWPCRPSVFTGVAPGRVHCGTGLLVGPQAARPSASVRQ